MADTTFSDAACVLFQKVGEAYIRNQCQHRERWGYCYGPDAADAIAELVAAGFLEPRSAQGRANTAGLTPLGERAILLSLIPVPTSEQRIAINLVADQLLAHREPFTKLFLQKKLEGTAQQDGLRVDATALLDSVDSTYLDAVEKYPNYRYDLTTIGWLASKHRPKIDLLVGGVLQLFRERLAEQSLHPYTWKERQDRGLLSDDSYS